MKVASKYARHLDAEVAFVHKRRRAEVHNEVAALQVVGDVEGRHAVIVDDMIDTAGTVAAAAHLLREAGATTVRAMATHGVLSPPAVDRLKNAPFEEIVTTNTLPVPQDALELPNLTVLSIAPLLGRHVEGGVQRRLRQQDLHGRERLGLNRLSLRETAVDQHPVADRVVGETRVPQA